MNEIESNDLDKSYETLLSEFRFHPTDEELIGFYLRRKLERKPLLLDLDEYEYNLWDRLGPAVLVKEKEKKARPAAQEQLKCPRCDSSNTKFCYYNNYIITQPIHFCKTCRRYWTDVGSLRNVPVGGGSANPNRVRRSEFGRASGSGSDLPRYFSNDPISSRKYSRTGSRKKEAVIVSNGWLDAMKASAPPREKLLQGSNAQVASIHYEIEGYRPLEIDYHSVLYSKNKKVAMSLDFDGTLSPIVHDPHCAFKPEADSRIRVLQEEIKNSRILLKNLQTQLRYKTMTNYVDHNEEFAESSTKRMRKLNHMDKTMKEHSFLTLPTDHVINIFDENQVLEEVQEQGLKPKHTTFLEFCIKAIYCTPELRATLGAALYAEQLGQIWALGNPFDMLSQSTITSKGTQASLISIEQAFSMFLPTILWSGMFLLSFIFAAKLLWSLPFRVPMILMLLLSLAYYFSALAQAVSGFKVLCGSITMPGLLFASGGAVGFVLLIGLVVMMVLWVTWCCIPNSEQQGKITPE